MKKILQLLLVTSLILLNTIPAIAHSGRTDSSGGHNCSAKSKAKGLCSGYHYHNGGYDSGSSSSSSSSGGSTSKSYTQPKPTYESANVTVYVNGKMMFFMQDPVIVNGSTLVPLREIFEELGATVEYDTQTKVIKATKGSKKVQLSVGSKTAYTESNQVTLSAAPIIVNGYTMVPTRFIAESFGASVSWDSETRIITVTN